MRSLLLALGLAASPSAAQVVSAPPSGGSIDTSQFATKSEVQAAQSAASAADTKATNAATTASAAQTTASDAATAAANAQTAAASKVSTVNGISPVAGALTVPIPTASTTVPPCIADSGTAGTAGTMIFAPFNHTHCSKARRGRATSAADGSLSLSFSPAFSNPPICAAVAEVASGVTDVVNVQIVGTPTVSAASLLVNRANRSVASLLGLTVLSIPSQPGATVVHWICIEP